MDKNIDKFKFYCPADILKAVDPKTGSQEMKIKGIASDSGRDSQGEFLDPSGMDLSSFKWLNWNHLGKNDPSTIIGEPTLSKITSNNELYIEGFLYPELKAAKDTFALMQALNNSPSGNKLSLSVEGKVISRDPKDPKRILKSKITAVALCPTPINSNTWVDLMKGEMGIDNEEEYDEDTKKAIIAEGNVTVKEDVEHNTKDLVKKPTLRKSDIYDAIFKQYPSIDIENAKSVYNLIEKIATMSKSANTVSDETIKKAFEILGIAEAEVEKADKAAADKADAEKNAKEADKANENNPAEDSEPKEKEVEEDEDKDMVDKAYGCAKEMKKSGDAKEAIKAKLIKKGYGEKVVEKAISLSEEMGGEIEKETPKDVVKSEELTLFAKSLSDLIKSQSEATDAKFRAIGEIMKAQTEENSNLKKSLEDTLDLNAELKKSFDAIASQPNPRKSVTVKSYSERFEKSEDGKETYNINSKEDRTALRHKLTDMSGIEKSENFDKGLMKIAQDLELTARIEPRDVQKLSSMGIKVVVG